MKKYLIALIILFGVYAGSAQIISGQVFMEQTVMGLQKGYGIRLQTNKGLGIGMLFQSNGKESDESVEDNYPFYGIETLVPITKCNNMRFFLTPKLGFVNQNFLVLIPAAETEIKISKMLSAGVTVGMRARQSTAGIKVILHL